MPEITTIFNDGRTDADIIAALQEKSVEIREWTTELIKLYEPTEHPIAKDKNTRKDKVRSDGTTDVAARIYLGLEKLLVSRITSFMFANPPKRLYHNTEKNDTRKDIAKAIELIYKHARIDNENIKRGKAYFASCEVFTIWYTVESPNTLYGFQSKYKLKCKSYSPMDGVKLYPLLDERDDMIAMSFEYTKKRGAESISFFETYTADKHYLWEQSGSGWKRIVDGEKISIMKIPGVYNWRPEPFYYGLSHIREDIEYTLSRNSDVIAYNSAPILKVAGSIEGVESKGNTQRVYRVENGGDVQYVSWAQADSALRYHIETLMNMYFMQAQMPDISFENMKSLGNIGYDARMTLLTDAHLKVGEEAGAWIEFLERECNVIKAFLKEMNKSWSSEIDNVEVEHIISPYIQNDVKADIQSAMAACGGKPVISQEEAVQLAGLSADPSKTIEKLKNEADEEMKNRLSVTEAMLSGGM